MHMKYDSPGFRHESDTSREAADKLTTAQKNQRLALEYIRQQGLTGATIDELSEYLTKLTGKAVPPNAISGRFIELEEKGLVSKTPGRRKTRAGRAAVVYVAGSWRDHMVPPAHECAPPFEESKLDAYKAEQRAKGHGHVIPRNDGRKEGCGGINYCKTCKQTEAYFKHMEDRVNA